MLCLFAALCSLCFAQDNPLVSKRMSYLIQPYILTAQHPAKEGLDELFNSERIITDSKTFTEAGFTILYNKEPGEVKVANHPDFPGYLFKVYFDEDISAGSKQGERCWMNLLKRCASAARMKQFIHENKLLYFTVPDKWLYPLPPKFCSDKSSCQPFLLIVEDMQLVSDEKCREAWKRAGPEVLDELYLILKKGWGSNYLPDNVPFTEKGVFAFIDTEYPHRNISLDRVTRYLSEPMQTYWGAKIR